MSRSPRHARRWPVLIVALLLGLGLHADPVPESPGRWVADPARAVTLERAWMRDYCTLRPRVGDRISTGLFVAWAEGEDGWAAAYLARQRAALRRAVRRLPSAESASWLGTAPLLDRDRERVARDDRPGTSTWRCALPSTSPGCPGSAGRTSEGARAGAEGTTAAGPRRADSTSPFLGAVAAPSPPAACATGPAASTASAARTRGGAGHV